MFVIKSVSKATLRFYGDSGKPFSCFYSTRNTKQVQRNKKAHKSVNQRHCDGSLDITAKTHFSIRCLGSFQTDNGPTRAASLRRNKKEHAGKLKGGGGTALRQYNPSRWQLTSRGRWRTKYIASDQGVHMPSEKPTLRLDLQTTIDTSSAVFVINGVSKAALRFYGVSGKPFSYFYSAWYTK